MIKKLLLTALVCSSALVSAEQTDVPIFIDIGVGPALVDYNASLLSPGQNSYALKFEASGSVKSDTLKANKSKLPDDVPDWLLDGDITASPWWIPKTFFVTPGGENLASVYGVRIAPDLGLGVGLGPIALRGAVGLDLTYLYLDNADFDEHHFIRPGVHISYEAALEPVEFLEISIGQDRQRYWPMNLSNGESFSGITETYIKVNVKIPYTVQIDL